MTIVCISAFGGGGGRGQVGWGGVGGLGGVKLLPNFQKGELDRTSTLRGGLLEKRRVFFFRGGGELQFLYTKN